MASATHRNQGIVTPRAFTIPDAAERLGCHRATIYRLITRGHLRTTWVLSEQRVPEDALLMLIGEGMSGPSPIASSPFAKHPTRRRRT